MKLLLSACMLLFTLPGGAFSQTFETDSIPSPAGNLNITFIGHGTLMFEFAGKIIHVDPWTQLADYSKLPAADIILITHEHRDHLDPAAIKSASKKDTVIIATEKCAILDSIVMNNGDSQTVCGFQIAAVPAYNIEHKRPDGNPFHPKGDGNGYIISFAGIRVLVAGDTENIPELKALKNIDIAFLPMNLPYTMTPEMAADTALAMRPKLLYPYHFGETDTSVLCCLLKNATDISVRIRKMK